MFLVAETLRKAGGSVRRVAPALLWIGLLQRADSMMRSLPRNRLMKSVLSRSSISRSPFDADLPFQGLALMLIRLEI